MKRSPATGTRKKISDFLGILYILILTFSVMYGPQPLFAAIHADFPVDEASIGLLVGVALLPLGIAPLFYGALLSAISVRRLLIASMSLLMLAGVPIFFTETFAVLLGFRLIQGLLVPAILTSLMAQISSRYQGAELQRAMAAYVGATILGGFFGRILTAFAADLFGWRPAMLLPSLLLGLGVVIITFFAEDGAQPRFHRVRAKDFAHILNNSILLRLLFCEAGGLFVFTAIGNCLPFYLNSLDSEISELRVAFMYSGYLLGALAAFSSRRLIRFFGGETRAVFAALCLLFCTMPGFFSSNTGVVFCSMTLMCGAQFMQHSICPGLINRLSGEERGVVNGLCLACYYTGGALGSYVSIAVFTAVSWSACIVLVALVVAAMAGVAFSLRNILPEKDG